MNHKRMIFVLIGLLRCFMYGMENANQPSNDQVPNNYFLCGEKFLPKKYENDFQLKNFIFCPDTKKYVMNEKIQEKFDCYSVFPSLEKTRVHAPIWRIKGGAEATYRIQKITDADLALLAVINKAAITKQ